MRALQSKPIFLIFWHMKWVDNGQDIKKNQYSVRWPIAGTTESTEVREPTDLINALTARRQWRWGRQVETWVLMCKRYPPSDPPGPTAIPIISIYHDKGRGRPNIEMHWGSPTALLYSSNSEKIFKNNQWNKTVPFSIVAEGGINDENLYPPSEPPTACCQGAFIEETNLFWDLHLLSLFQLVRVTRWNENVILFTF